MKRMLAALGVALAACSEPSPPATFSINIPWTAAAAQCTDTSGDLAGLRASLEISSYPFCELAINPTTLAAYGSCADIQVGEVRSLAVIYRVVPIEAGVQPTVIAFHIGYVDLTGDDLADDVSVALAHDGTSGHLVRTTNELLALPVANGTELREAETWLSALAAERGYNLDADDDNCSNIDEACNNTLFEANNTTCAQ